MGERILKGNKQKKTKRVIDRRKVTRSVSKIETGQSFWDRGSSKNHFLSHLHLSSPEEVGLPPVIFSSPPLISSYLQ